MNSTNKPRRTPAETQAIVERSLRRRYWAERRFRAYGLAAVTAGMAFLVYLFFVIFSNGIGAFQQTQIQLPVYYDPQIIDPAGTRNPDDLQAADYQAVIRAALKAKFPEVEGRAAHARAHAPGERQRGVRSAEARRRGPGVDRHDRSSAGCSRATPSTCCRRATSIARLPEAERPLSDQQLAWTDKLQRRRRARRSSSTRPS